MGPSSAITDEARAAIAAAAPGHVPAVRELFIDRLTPTQLETVARRADFVLDGLDVGSQGSHRKGGRTILKEAP